MPCMHLLVKTIRVWPRDVFDWVLGLQTFLERTIVKMKTKMETEQYVLTADDHDGLSCTVLLALGLRLFPG